MRKVCRLVMAGAGWKKDSMYMLKSMHLHVMSLHWSAALPPALIPTSTEKANIEGASRTWQMVQKASSCLGLPCSPS